MIADYKFIVERQDQKLFILILNFILRPFLAGTVYEITGGLIDRLVYAIEFHFDVKEKTAC
jgi:hypothetical protein